MTAPELHKLFCEVTGQKLTLSYERQMMWSQYVQRGLTEEDLRLVVRWTRAQIARAESEGKGGFSRLSMQFRAMVEDLDKFEDRLNVARQSRHARKPAGEKAAAPAPEGAAAMTDEEWEAKASAVRAKLGQLREQLSTPYQPVRAG
jgi:hypothetical protein